MQCTMRLKQISPGSADSLRASWVCASSIICPMEMNMEPVELEKLTKSFAALKESTKSRQVQWRRVNPSTFVWTKTEENRPAARVLLQKVPQSIDPPFSLVDGRPLSRPGR